MSKHWPRGMLLGVSLTLLLVGIGAARGLGRPEITTPPKPPTAVEGLFVTTEDNENNSGTGTADGDMGYTDPGYTCTDELEAPVEFNIMVREEVCSDGVLSLQGFNWEGGDAYLNGHLLGTTPDLFDGEWVLVEFDVPMALLDRGSNLVEILFDEWACAVIAWGTLAIEPCAVEEEFVPEPGSILLLGSGLAGLAGYATLRWRTRE